METAEKILQVLDYYKPEERENIILFAFRTNPDNLGRQHFSLHRWGCTPFTDYKYTWLGQHFFTNPEPYLNKYIAASKKVVSLNFN